VFNQLSKAIDRISAAAGALSSWLLLGMVLLGAFNAIARYLDRFTGLSLSSNTYIELQWYFFAALFLLAAAYTLQSDSHVRVDVIYGRLSDRGRAIINVAGTLLFLLPFCMLMIVTSWPTVRNSWAILEQSPDPGGLARYPIKTIIPIAFVLLLLQGLALLFRQLPVALGRSSASVDSSSGTSVTATTSDRVETRSNQGPDPDPGAADQNGGVHGS
jgi:TRAP-type mannitol/chloroaromatic compound transport system permease small subunit